MKCSIRDIMLEYNNDRYIIMSPRYILSLYVRCNVELAKYLSEKIK